MTDMDIQLACGVTCAPIPPIPPHPGAHLETAGPGITISVTQECQIALPPRSNLIPAVSVTVTSQRPGMAAQVTIAANFNTPDGSYQGPTTTVGQGQFTATNNAVSQPSSTYDLHHGRHEARQPPLPPQPHMATLAADKLSNLQAAPSISCASYIHIVPRASAAR